MNIAILTLGARGDVQPYPVLGKALKQRGHQVTLSTARNFKQLVKSFHIGFLPVETDFQEVIKTEDGNRMIKGNLFAIQKNLHTWIYPLITQALTEFYNLAKKNDLVVYHVKTLADCFADQFPGKNDEGFCFADCGADIGVCQSGIERFSDSQISKQADLHIFSPE